MWAGPRPAPPRSPEAEFLLQSAGGSVRRVILVKASPCRTRHGSSDVATQRCTKRHSRNQVSRPASALATHAYRVHSYSEGGCEQCGVLDSQTVGRVLLTWDWHLELATTNVRPQRTSAMYLSNHDWLADCWLLLPVQRLEVPVDYFSVPTCLCWPAQHHTLCPHQTLQQPY